MWGYLITMHRTLLVNIRLTEGQRASLNLQPARAFVDVVQNMFSLIIFVSQFMGYSPSEEDNSRDSLKV